MSNPLPENFMKRVNVTDTCWLWTGSKKKSGYGKYSTKGGQVYTHRFSWECFNGKITNGLFVLHKCDVKLCVNPNHLFLGTNQDNMRDKVLKNRQSSGENSGMAKLTKIQIDEIRRLYEPGKVGRGAQNEFSVRGLSRKYGISPIQISRIIRHERWTKQKPLG